jgi:hypothetical protein
MLELEFVLEYMNKKIKKLQTPNHEASCVQPADKHK